MGYAGIVRLEDSSHCLPTYLRHALSVQLGNIALQKEAEERVIALHVEHTLRVLLAATKAQTVSAQLTVSPAVLRLGKHANVLLVFTWTQLLLRACLAQWLSITNTLEQLTNAQNALRP